MAQNLTPVPASNFHELITLMGGPAEFERLAGGPAGQGKIWRRRGRVPKKYWAAIVRVGEARGWKLTADQLSKWYDQAKHTGY